MGPTSLVPLPIKVDMLSSFEQCGCMRIDVGATHGLEEIYVFVCLEVCQQGQVSFNRRGIHV